ncbi:MAG: hypothetical protein QME77_13645 [bacterium]|nr:hypothetical protein [bacterium]
MKKITVRFDDELHKRLRHLSVEREESLQQMIVRLLRAELERHEAAKKPPRRR